MIDTMKMILEIIKNELLPNEDRWGELSETQYTQLYLSRTKVANVISMLEGLHQQIIATRKVIGTMEASNG